ncbi:MAG: glycerophosphodiester phosphodiesterase family protein [Candidatus Hydrogenedentes bacterium]|nr:glycerophosphodiester phosphodiesterase family protein [Candidatus Hydrogenedentota bacterium]
MAALGGAQASTSSAEPLAPGIIFQAHRGGVREVPENTLAAFRHAWSLGGLAEVDICTTKDGEIICLHDDTLARTTNAPESVRRVPVSELTSGEIRQWDAGAWFGEKFAGERVPTLREVFGEMRAAADAAGAGDEGEPQGCPGVYLDYKNVDLAQLAGLIQEYGVAKQIIFCHCNQSNCIELQKLAPNVRTMLWIGGKAAEIRAKFDEVARGGFKGLDQVQLHLAVEKVDGGLRYAIDAEYLQHALDAATRAGIDFEVFPFDFDDASLAGLLDLGIQWFATDEPKRFRESVERWEQAAGSR